MLPQVEPAPLEHPVDHRDQRAVALARLAAALEQHGVAALPGQPDDLNQRVGPRLEHHAEHAERAGLALQHQTVVQLAPQRHLVGELGHRGQLPQPLDHAVELGASRPRRLIDAGAGARGRGGARAFQIGALAEKIAWRALGLAQRRRQVAQQRRAVSGRQRRQRRARRACRHCAIS